MFRTVAVFTALLAASGCVTVKQTASSQPSKAAMQYNVRDFGAVGDGAQDDTQAFQAALDAAHDAGGGIVFVPAGRYLIQTHLVLPPNTSLQGVSQWGTRGQPARGETEVGGSILLAVEGKGDPNGHPFLTMNTNTGLRGLTIFYPEQVKQNPPYPYPWTVRNTEWAEDCAIIGVTIINPYQAVDFGTYVNQRHYIDGLYAHALYRGLYINQCYDVGRIQNVHFWPFWDTDPNSPLWVFTRENGVAYTIGRTDGELGFNCFSIFYKIGMHFIRGPIGDTGKTSPGSGVYTNCYMDVSPCAIQVDDVGQDAGISFVNGMFMSRVKVSPSNKGEVKFTGCGFWAIRGLDSHAQLEGPGMVFFESCHFSKWDQDEKGAPAIDANNAELIVTGSKFKAVNMKGEQVPNKVKVRLGPNVKSAVVANNIMSSGVIVDNQAPPEADVQIGLNAGK